MWEERYTTVCKQDPTILSYSPLYMSMTIFYRDLDMDFGLSIV